MDAKHLQEMANGKDRAIAALATRVRALEDERDEKDRWSAVAKVQSEARLEAARVRERELLADADRSKAAVYELQLKLTGSVEALNTTVVLERAARREVDELKATLQSWEEKLVAWEARWADVEPLRQRQQVVSTV